MWPSGPGRRDLAHPICSLTMVEPGVRLTRDEFARLRAA